MIANKPKIRVVVVDDHSLFRRGVIAAIGTEVDVVGEADDVASGIATVAAQQPDVALIDVQLPSGSGAEIIEALATDGFDMTRTRFLGLSVSERPADVLRLVRSGARGYVTKRIDSQELVSTIRQVAAGHAIFSPQLAGVVLGQLGGRDPSSSNSDETKTSPDATDRSANADLARLSPREREVMRYVARGYTYKEIAAELVISARTVESHVASVLRKLQLSNRHVLTHWAVSNKLV